MTNVILPPGEQQFSDASGRPYVNGKVYTYIPNTLTPKTTYQNADSSIANTNPIVLDSAGRAIIWGDSDYRQMLYDAAGNLVWDRIISFPFLPASSIRITDAGDYYTSNNVESALQELGDRVERYADVTAARAINFGYPKAIFISGTDGGLFRRDPTDTTSAEDGGSYCGTIIRSADYATRGVWKRVFDGTLRLAWFGCVPDATWNNSTLQFSGTDNTAAVNLAITAAVTLKYAIEDSGAYYIAGTLNIDGECEIRGSGGKTPNGVPSGLVFCAGKTVSSVYDSGTRLFSNPLVQIDQDVTGGYFYPVTFRDVHFIGSGLWAADAERADRACLQVAKRQHVRFEGECVIHGFKKPAIAGMEAWDCFWFGVFIQRCGELGATGRGASYAVHFDSVSDSCNEHHFVGMRMEANYAFMYIYSANLGGDIKFTNCKFEYRNIQFTAAPFYFERVGRVVFDATTNMFFDSNWASSPYTIIIGTCNEFVMDGTKLKSNTSGRGKWIDQQTAGIGNGIQLTGVEIKYPDNQGHFMRLKGGSQISNLKVTQNLNAETARYGMMLGGDVVMTNIVFAHEGTPGTLTSGILFEFSDGTQNTANNSITGLEIENDLWFVLGQSFNDSDSSYRYNKVEFITPKRLTLSGLETTPSVLGYASIVFNNGSATSVTKLRRGYEGQRLSITANNGNTTLVHDGVNLRLSGSANFVTTGNNGIDVVNTNGTLFREVSRVAY